MIVVDTSALIAISTDEPGSRVLDDVLLREMAVVSAGTLAEALIVAGQRRVMLEVESVVARAGIEIVEVTEAQSRQMGDAYARWGRGNHPAGLNFGDCFAYTLAKGLGAPLLFIGNDLAGLTSSARCRRANAYHGPCYARRVQRAGRPLRAYESVEESPDSTGQGAG